jgi:hypothetical protein
MSDVAIICGMQRCGSNYFLSVARRLQDLLVLGEMYHRGGAFPFQLSRELDYRSKQALAAAVLQQGGAAAKLLEGHDPTAPFSPESEAAIDRMLVQISHKAPNRYLEAMLSMAGEQRLLFKVFPEHLETFQILSMLREHRPSVLLMARDPLDSFISYRKLVETRKPQDVDTSGLKVHFNKAEYYAYKAHLVAYFKAIQQFCGDEGLELSVCHYEWLHNNDGRDKTEKVREVVQRMFGTALHWKPEADKLKTYQKQDTTPSPAEKVLNPAQLPRSPQHLLD